ncbi:MAG TPA: hypothetical protein VMF70_01965 [Gemmatimonadales bacterium]|nr:hypothetical protein [Gemmatimonadales bacterium]
MRSIRSKLAGALAAMALTALIAHPSFAQQPPSAPPPEYGSPTPAAELGARAGYDWGLAAFSAGVQLQVPVIPGFALVPSVDCFLHTPFPQWQLNLDASFRLGLYGGLYGGAGLGITHRDLGTVRSRSGLNVFVGFSPPRLARRAPAPFVQARWLLVGNRSPFAVVAGVSVAL